MPKIVTLDMNAPSVQYLCRRDKRLAKVISMVGPISYYNHSDAPYPFLIHEVIEQMLSVKSAEKIYNRLVELCGGAVCVEAITNLTDSDIKGIGTANSKVLYIRSITEAVLDGTLDFKELTNMSEQDAFNKLCSIKGIGSWTAKMYLLFVLDLPDILPVEDAAFQQVFQWVYKTTKRDKSTIMEKCHKWSPYSSIGTRFFYKALDMGITKTEIHLFK